MKKKMSLEMAATEWLCVKTQQKHLEKKLSELKPVLEAHLHELEQKSAECHGWKFSLVEFVKRSFNLAKAEAKLEKKVLAPFITKSQVTQIRTSWQGGEIEEKEAA